MRVGVCDFPSLYAFPPYGYGGIERWLWAVTVGAEEAGADVTLIGPGWRSETEERFHRLPWRLEDLEPSSPAVVVLDRCRFDVLVVGHEYASLPAWRHVQERLGADVTTFQHCPNFAHAPSAFDGVNSRLYCYSEEMLRRYGQHRPLGELAVHCGWQEDPSPPSTGGDLIWIGRIVREKAPHLAVMAASRLGLRIRIVGPVLDPVYAEQHETLWAADNVEMVGEVAGSQKVTLLRKARTLVYTCARDYVEAGAAVFGEALRAGTPVAALVWRPGGCAEAALCHNRGRVACCHGKMDDNQVAEQLADAIERSRSLPAATVQDVGMERFDAARHARALMSRPVPDLCAPWPTSC